MPRNLGHTLGGYGMHTLYLDVKEEDMKGLKIDDKVVLKVKGKIRALRGKEEYKSSPCCGDEDEKEKTETIPPEVSIEIEEVEVTGNNQFEVMAAEDD